MPKFLSYIFLLLIISCSSEGDKRVMLSHSDNDVSIADFGYVGNWISQCNDSNNNIRMDIRNNKLKIFELSSTNYSECNNRSFSSQSTSEYSYNTVASTEEEKNLKL